ERPRGGGVDEPDLRLENGEERALAAHDGLGHVHAAVRTEEPVEVVAADAAGDLRVPLLDQGAVAVAEVAEARVDLAAAAPGADAGDAPAPVLLGDAGHGPAQVDDCRVVAGLAREAGPAAAVDDRGVVVTADLDGRRHVVL